MILKMDFEYVGWDGVEKIIWPRTGSVGRLL
jgi:hypothetical protein